MASDDEIPDEMDPRIKQMLETINAKLDASIEQMTAVAEALKPKRRYTEPTPLGLPIDIGAWEAALRTMPESIIHTYTDINCKQIQSVTTRDVLVAALGITNKSPVLGKVLSRVMAHLGWSRKPNGLIQNCHGRPQRGYYRPAPQVVP